MAANQPQRHLCLTPGSLCASVIINTLRLRLLRQENERSMRENLERTLMMKNMTELNLQRQQQLLMQAQQQQQHQQQHHKPLQLP
ncbi:hypothetical protein AWZ03_005871 [Drosophila navojoa]|uniref:Uncharacterized protein n=1 Tax=Drosophila navojoa TaxID=7232 RepID=A0A484BFT8_DRONA|nr:hypothetical protein AWZ03_005871 [Drosophila navojoa]